MSTIPTASHAGFERDERDYWAMREELLQEYYGKWVAVHNGKVAASGDDMVEVAHSGAQADGYAYCNLVGLEDKVVVRNRREFQYQEDYWPRPIPRIEAIVSNPELKLAQTSSLAIPDTGSDLSCLPKSVCEALDLYGLEVFRGASRGVGGRPRSTVFLRASFMIADKTYLAIVEPVDDDEWIIGRDVLNKLVATFDGPGRKVIIE